jgi:hypothetical protein
MPRGFFSIGGLIARWWPGGGAGIAPWIVASSVLMSGALWDWVRAGGVVDFVLLGLAAYELVIGLTEETPARQAQRVVSQRSAPELRSRSRTTH